MAETSLPAGSAMQTQEADIKAAAVKAAKAMVA